MLNLIDILEGELIKEATNPEPQPKDRVRQLHSNVFAVHVANKILYIRVPRPDLCPAALNRYLELI